MLPDVPTMSAAEKLRNDEGQIAVLYSPCFGAGWFSWNTEIPECLYDAEVARAVQCGDHAKAYQIAESKWPRGYWGGACDLRIEWMAPGTAFRIDEYDGRESIVYADHEEWQVVPL
jgi:hypothetical protein